MPRSDEERVLGVEISPAFLNLHDHHSSAEAFPSQAKKKVPLHLY